MTQTFIEQAGLTPEEVAAVAASDWPNYKFTDPKNTAVAKLVRAAQVECEEVRPFRRNDVVSLAWMPKSRFRIVCVDGGQVWAQDLSDGGRLTLNIDTIERVKP